MDIRSWQRSRELAEAAEIGRRVVAEVGDQGDDPAAAFLGKHDSAALALRGWRDDRRLVSVEMFGPPPEGAGGIAEGNLYAVLRRPPVAHRLEPPRAV